MFAVVSDGIEVVVNANAVALERLIAPTDKVMAGVEVGVATVPDIPLAVTTDTEVTVPVLLVISACATFLVTPPWTMGISSVPVSGVVAAGSSEILTLAMTHLTHRPQ